MEFLFNWLDLSTFQYSDLMIVAVLVVMEGLLSCDNAVVLAMIVKDLPKEIQGKALRYGILGAYFFRLVAIALATFILGIWWLKVLGGLYLCYLAIHFFLQNKDENSDGIPDAFNENKPVGKKFLWFTVSPLVGAIIAVELTDIVFSVDSIAAAVALSSKVWVLIAGGFIGILAMRFAAQGFLVLLKKFPKLEMCAFVAVGFIGLKLCCEVPVDLFVGTTPVTEKYTDAASYKAAADKVTTLSVDGHVFRIVSAVPAPPDEAVIAAAAPTPKDGENEINKAKSYWNLHARPLVHLEGFFSSLIVLAIFALGFLKPARKNESV